MKFPLYIGNFGWRIGCRIQDGCRTNPTFSVFFISFPLLFWPQSHAFSCQMRQETVGLFDVSSDIILPVTIFHYNEERRRLRNFVDANTTWILAMENVVNCWIFCTFAGAVTTFAARICRYHPLCFAEIFVPLLVQLQSILLEVVCYLGCDLLKFLYLCWCSYNSERPHSSR